MRALIFCFVALITIGYEKELELTEVEGIPACDQLKVKSAPVRPNVVLIIDDTMRRERAGAYGGNARTPNFDASAAEALLFEHAFAPLPRTKPSIACELANHFSSGLAVLAT